MSVYVSKGGDEMKTILDMQCLETGSLTVDNTVVMITKEGLEKSLLP